MDGGPWTAAREEGDDGFVGAAATSGWAGGRPGGWRSAPLLVVLRRVGAAAILAVRVLQLYRTHRDILLQDTVVPTCRCGYPYPLVVLLSLLLLDV